MNSWDSIRNTNKKQDTPAVGNPLRFLAAIPVSLAAAFSLASDTDYASVASITGSSLGQSISGSSLGQSISGSSLGQSISGSSLGQSISGSSISLSTSSFVSPSIYVVGHISSLDNLAGTISLGDLVVFVGSAPTYGPTSLGSLVVVSGIQVGSANLVIADAVTGISEAIGADEDPVLGNSFR